MPQLTLTNRQVEECVKVLPQVTAKTTITRADKSVYEGLPAISARVRLALAQSLRKLKKAWDDKEEDRIDLVKAHFVGDNSDPDKADAEVKRAFNTDLEQLMRKEVSVDIRQILITTEKSTDESLLSLHPECAPLDPTVLATLLDAEVFKEHDSCNEIKETK